VIRYEEP